MFKNQLKIIYIIIILIAQCNGQSVNSILSFGQNIDKIIGSNSCITILDTLSQERFIKFDDYFYFMGGIQQLQISIRDSIMHPSKYNFSLKKGEFETSIEFEKREQARANKMWKKCFNKISLLCGSDIEKSIDLFTTFSIDSMRYYADEQNMNLSSPKIQFLDRAGYRFFSDVRINETYFQVNIITKYNDLMELDRDGYDINEIYLSIFCNSLPPEKAKKLQNLTNENSLFADMHFKLFVTDYYANRLEYRFHELTLKDKHGKKLLSWKNKLRLIRNYYEYGKLNFTIHDF